MNRLLPAALAAFALAALPAAADLYGGTDRDAIAVGGSFFWDSATEDGKDLSLELHGGYYVADALLVGGSLAVRDDDVADTWELSALCQYHFLRAFDPANDRPWGLSPYAGLRLGLDVFFTDNVVLDVALDLAACTAEVYPDDYKRKKTDCTLRVGLDFHF